MPPGPIFPPRFVADPVDRGGYSTVAQAAGTTVLTLTSQKYQFSTGSGGQTYQLPVVSTLSLGFSFVFFNNGSDAITITSSDTTSVIVVFPGNFAELFCILLTGTTPGSWSATGIYSAVNTNIALGNAASAGLYAPTFTDLSPTPVATITQVDDFQYISIQGGSTVTVSGAIDLKLTAVLATQLVRIEISLPTGSSGWTPTEGNCCGTGTGLDTTTGLVIVPALVKGNVTDLVAEVDFFQLPAFGGDNFRLFVQFTYKS